MDRDCQHDGRRAHRRCCDTPLGRASHPHGHSMPLCPTSLISTSASSGSKAKATPTKNGNAQPTPNLTKSTPAKPKRAEKEAAPGSDESEEEEGSWNNEDSDEEYGKPRAKRAKFDAKGPMRRMIKTENCDEEEDTPFRALKHKHQSSKSFSRDLSAYGTTDINGPMRRMMKSRMKKTKNCDEEEDTPFKALKRKRKRQSFKSFSRDLSASGTTDIDGKPINDYSDVEDDTKEEIVAAGAPWLALEDDYVSHPKTGKKTPYKKKSLVVSLPTTPYKTSMVGTVKEEDTSDMSGGEVDNESDDEVVGGRVESYVDGSHVFSNQDMDHEFSNSPYNQNFEDLAAAQMEPASGTMDHNGMYKDSYHDRPQVTPSNGDSYQGRQTFVDAYNNDYNNPSAGMFENDGLGQSQAMEHPEGFGSSDGGNFTLGQISTNFNQQSAGGFGAMNGGFIGGTFDNNGGVDNDSFGNGAMSNGIIQPDASGYQTGNGYGASSNSFDNSVGGLPLSNGHHHPQNLVHQLEWVSAKDTSAFAILISDPLTIPNPDFSTNDDTAGLFNVGHFDGNFVGDGMFVNDLHGN
ncbi:hypothetical protein HO173_003185 [Letharia columbiana]|uniref:Uncharacterized protein n=1 Tax=Letharia columbiana TaxID=112416 RepID=A0A8H6L7N3_9LECA|nr:uncharacterized protein HO173_003185 [Letharia columbiana]KAF6238679.1 hypothetical protein HO173_003185 [Letharia columbiana]